MANLWIESFGGMATDMLVQKYYNPSFVTIYPTGGPRNGAYVNSGLTKLLTPGDNTCIVGQRLWTVTPGFWAVTILAGAGLESQCGLYVNGDGSLQFYRGASWDKVSLGISAPGVFVPQTWLYVEVKVVIHDATGSVSVRVNGSPVAGLQLTDVDTKFSATAGWSAIATAAVNRMADLYVNDGTGAVNNDCWGDTRVDAHFPNANGNSSQWDRSTGADQYATIDEAPGHNGDTDYNYTATVDEIDTVAVQNLINAGATIRAVQLNIAAKKTEEGTCEIAPVIRPASADIVGTAVVPSAESWRVFSQPYNVNPNGDIAWAETDFNACEFGYKRTA